MPENDSVKNVWAAFLSARPELVDASAAYSAWHFCSDRQAADELAQLVLDGTKRATAGAVWSYEAENEPLPRVGEFSVITDWAGTACCVIRLTSVEIVAFDAVTAEFAATEGEGDGSLEYWRDVHWAYFTKELREFGREPRLDMPVVCERFDVVFRAGTA